MKILITGATGLVGTAIHELSRSRNISVNYLTTSKEKLNSEKGLQGFYWDPEQGKIDPDCFKNVSAIINLAGASISKRWTEANRKLILDSRINSLRTLYKG
ncbi:MAG: NAD-dependent epimerase/dehydratase family protein, partial [Eudoraea sp.]|nr:NAD-dependent epimerase/dehydratase family protein [Eudoraea sp.]